MVFAPSEAETLLVVAQKAGIGDAILTSASDMLGLGGIFVIYDLNFSNGKYFIFNQSDLLDALKSRSGAKPLLIVLCC